MTRLQRQRHLWIWLVLTPILLLGLLAAFTADRGAARSSAVELRR